MIPSARVVPSPSGGVALASGISRASQYEGPLIGVQLQEALKGTARVLHAEYVVNLTLVSCAGLEARLFNTIRHVEGNRLGGRLKNGRLVHVVPKASGSDGIEMFIKCPPPLS